MRPTPKPVTLIICLLKRGAREAPYGSLIIQNKSWRISRFLDGSHSITRVQIQAKSEYFHEDPTLEVYHFSVDVFIFKEVLRIGMDFFDRVEYQSRIENPRHLANRSVDVNLEELLVFTSWQTWSPLSVNEKRTRPNARKGPPLNSK